MKMQLCLLAVLVCSYTTSGNT